MRKSPWRSEVYAPPGLRVEEPEQIFFGAQVSWDGARDHSMGTQDTDPNSPRYGLWSLGNQRRTAACPHCGNDPAKGVYCARCSSVNVADEKKLRDQRECERLRALHEESKKRQAAFAQRIAKAKEKRRAAAGVP